MADDKLVAQIGVETKPNATQELQKDVKNVIGKVEHSPETQLKIDMYMDSKKTKQQTQVVLKDFRDMVYMYLN